MTKEKHIPILDLHGQYESIKPEIHEAVNRVLDSQNFILGKEVIALEKEIAEYCGVKYAVGVSSGTDALMVALMALGIKEGDEVITSPHSFFSTSSAIVRLGARPVYTDVFLHTYGMLTDDIESLITPRTKAILPVHFAGQVSGMSAIKEISDYYKIPVIEDACQSIGATYYGKKAGSIGDIGCFSFYPSKNLGGYGDSGMAITNDEYLATKMRILRNHGQNPKYYNEVIGGNFRMDDIQAAVLRVKLKYLEGWIEKRREHADIYREHFRSNNTMVSYPIEKDGCRHTYHLFIIRSNLRDEISNALRKRGIESGIYYPLPLHLQPCFSYLGYKRGDFLLSELASETNLAIPVYPELTEEDILRIASIIHSVVV